MNDRSVLVVGAGIGGLATGSYLQRNGYRATVLEAGTGPGGVCTAWSRKGYVFDGCIHNLAGSGPNSPLHALWDELGVTTTIPMHAYSELVRVERDDGEPLTVYADLDRLQEHLHELSPHDGAVIDELITSAKRFRGFDLLGLAVAERPERVRALAKLPLLSKWGGTTLARFAARFRDPFLQSAFPTLVYDWPKQSMVILLYFLAALHEKDLGWPIGGSAVFANAIARRFLELGGRIEYGTHVQSILVENDRAIGVRLGDGSERRAATVVCNAYGRTAIFEMLGGRYTNRAIRSYYAAPDDRVEMGIHVSLGVARDLSAEPHAIVWPLPRPTVIAGERRERFFIEPFGFDATLAPRGKAPLKVVLATSYDYWERLATDPSGYAEEKQLVARAVIEALGARFPGLEREIEVVDVATPITTFRHTGNGRGFKGSPTRMLRAFFTGRRLSQTLPGLDRFYMVGQWAGLPGVSMVAAMGRDVARAICRRDGRAFATR